MATAETNVHSLNRQDKNKTKIKIAKSLCRGRDGVITQAVNTVSYLFLGDLTKPLHSTKLCQNEYRQNVDACKRNAQSHSCSRCRPFCVRDLLLLLLLLFVALGAMVVRRGFHRHIVARPRRHWIGGGRMDPSIDGDVVVRPHVCMCVFWLLWSFSAPDATKRVV